MATMNSKLPKRPNTSAAAKRTKAAMTKSGMSCAGIFGSLPSPARRSAESRPEGVGTSGRARRVPRFETIPKAKLGFASAS